MSASRSLLEDVLPHFDARKLHDVWVPARPNVVFAAVSVTFKARWTLRRRTAMSRQAGCPHR
jgi:hypothetical protein